MKKAQKKVLVINTVEFGINGISNVIMNYFRYTKDKISFDFIVNKKIHESYKRELETENCKLYILQHRNNFPFHYIRRLKKIIEDGKYDIVHIHGNSALMSVEVLACKNSKSNAICVVHGHNTDCTHKKLHKLLYPWFIKNYDYGVACSKACGTWLYGDSPHYILNNGIQEERFRWNPFLRTKMRDKHQISEKNFVLLHIGLFNEQKNQSFLIEVFRKIVKQNPYAMLRLVGEGEKLEEIKNKVKEYGLEQYVTFVGTTLCPEEEYHMADVLVMPSLYESFGLVTVEAQCSGLPCVLSNQIPKEIAITDCVSFLSLEDSTEKWASQILAYKAHKRADQREQVIKKGYSISHEAQNLIAFYKNISN